MECCVAGKEVGSFFCFNLEYCCLACPSELLLQDCECNCSEFFEERARKGTNEEVKSIKTVKEQTSQRTWIKCFAMCSSSFILCDQIKLQEALNSFNNWTFYSQPSRHFRCFVICIDIDNRINGGKEKQGLNISDSVWFLKFNSVGFVTLLWVFGKCHNCF